MAEDHPESTIERSMTSPAECPSRRWYWNPWSWLCVLAVFLILVTGIQTRQLMFENAVAHQLEKRGYGVDWSEGWLHRIIPQRLRLAGHFLGDHVTQLHFHTANRGQLPLDDLIPQLHRLPCLCSVVLAAPDNSVEKPASEVADSISDIANRVTALKGVANLKSVCLTGFPESAVSEELIQSLQELNVERVCFFVSKCSDEDLTQIQKLPNLKVVTFFWCQPPTTGLHQFNTARPDVTVNTSRFTITAL